MEELLKLLASEGPKSDASRRGRPKLGMEAPLLAHGVQHPLGEYVRVWRWRALVAMSSPDMMSVFINN